MTAMQYCADETIRQSGTHEEAIRMYLVWERFFNINRNGYRLIEDDLKRAFATIKDDVPAYRQVEVTFRNVVQPALPADMVPRAMKRLGEQLNRRHDDFIADKNEYADYMAREFLIIHPFTDGNGRVASLVWNYLRGTIANPEPLPYFFGEK
jgi:Fic family protein